jgi:chromatin remodeling complex protein RSC6
MTDNNENIPSNLKKIKMSITKLKDKVNLCKFSILEINNDIQKMDIFFNNYMKSIQKPKRKVNKGFSKPTSITKELANFLKLDCNTKISRTEVTKIINTYIKDNNLQDSDNKKIIKPDTKLAILFGDVNEEINFFSMQKYLNKHFLKDN